jgi:hypothetical protein
VKIVERKAHLLQVVLTLHAPSRLTSRLHRRQQEGNQHADDRDYNQQLNERETAARGEGGHRIPDGLTTK